MRIAPSTMKLRNRHLLLLDAVLLLVSPWVLYSLRFEGFVWPAAHTATALTFTLAMIPLYIGVFAAFGLYQRLWRYASVSELELIFVAAGVAGVLSFALGASVLPALGLVPVRVPLSILFSHALLGVFIAAGSRLSIRISGGHGRRRRRTDAGRRILIAGAGTAGEMVLRELRGNQDLGMIPVGFVDDDVTKHGLRLSDLPIFGSLDEIPQIVENQKIEEILIAMPTAPGAVVRKIVRLAFDAGTPTRTVPGLFEILAERVSVSAFREVQIDDLLRREPVQTDLAAVSALASGRTVLVTGAGGSIGSELARQLHALGPAKLVLLGHGENPIFDILNELRERRFDKVEVVPVIADIRDRERIARVFAEHRPFAVFHAAAHKHVPLMEKNVVEAVTNNVLGTKNVVDAAVACGTEHFVLISTDKAVRPPNVMGACKRIAEHVVHNAAIKHRRNFVAVRFGNVLGSQGSVVPTFVRQIKAGGPVTVTHPEMRRYFMTIPEAVQLVLQAGALGKGGELFMLDMGEMVKIVDLARDMIRLSGLEEGVDIDIEFTGMRPGEKLYEEMFFSHEVAVPTNHPKILRARNGHQEHVSDAQIVALISAARANEDEECIRRLLQELVPDFTNGKPAPPREVSGERTHATAELPAVARAKRATAG